MSDDQQRQEAEQRRRFSMPQGMDPRNFDPRKVMDAAAVERMLKAQAIARAEAQAATTVVIATVVSLVTSAFSFVAALAWNAAVQDLLQNKVGDTFFGIKLDATGKAFIYAIIVTLLAIFVTLLVNRFAGNLAKKSAIAAASANS